MKYEHYAYPAPLLAVLLFAAGCEGPGDGAVLAIESAGTLGLSVYVDRDGSGGFEEGNDTRAADLPVFVRDAAGDIVANVTTTMAGTASVAGLPVGSYTIVVPAESLGDTLQSELIPVRIVAEDSTHAFLALVPPLRTVSEASEGGTGEPVLIQGIALNAWETFGDSTVSVMDDTGIVQVRGIQPVEPVAAGDTVRVWGRMERVDQHSMIGDAVMFRRAGGEAPPATAISTAEGAAGEPSRDRWGLVRIGDATVVDILAGAGGDRHLLVDDGSGILELVLDGNAGIELGVPEVPGLLVNATGLLLPVDDGIWRVKPRASDDVEARVPTAQLIEARAFDPGALVAVTGVALNGVATFGDASVHLSDSSGALRVLQVSGSAVFAGDSVRVIGRVGLREGRSVLLALAGVPPAILTRTATPAPVALSTMSGSTAEAGRWDAMLARVASAVVQDTATIGGEMHLTVDDGSGPLRVVVDRDTAIRTSDLVPGLTVDLTGVLLPTEGERWLLKPRAPTDVVRR